MLTTWGRPDRPVRQLPPWRDSQSLSNSLRPLASLAVDTRHRIQSPSSSYNSTNTGALNIYCCSKMRLQISRHTKDLKKKKKLYWVQLKQSVFFFKFFSTLWCFLNIPKFLTFFFVLTILGLPKNFLTYLLKTFSLFFNKSIKWKVKKIHINLKFEKYNFKKNNWSIGS